MWMRAFGATLALCVVVPLVQSQPIPLPSERLPGDPKLLKPVGELPDSVRKIFPAPDLSAERIDFRVVRKTDKFRGRVEIQGTVKNLGGDYLSGAKQQEVQLFEEVPGGRPRLVARLPFTRLNSGAELTIRYQRDWNASSPSEGEFPPTYRLVIVFDPDIRMDGNPRNDDRNAANNQRSRAGTPINGMLSR